MQSRRFSKLIPWLFAAPALVALSLFFVYPTIVTIFLSFTRGTITTPAKEFVGFDNYRILLTEDRFFLSFEDGVLSGALVNSFAWLIIFPNRHRAHWAAGSGPGRQSQIRSHHQIHHVHADGDLRHRRRRHLSPALQSESQPRLPQRVY